MTHPWKQRWLKAHEEWFKIHHPIPYSDGHYCPPINYSPLKANGLTEIACLYLKWTGNHGERTNNMGRPVTKYKPKMNIHTGQVESIENGVEWQKGTGIKGTSDIKGHIHNKKYPLAFAIYIEVKAGRDWQKEDQKKYEKSIHSSGALYLLMRHPDDLFALYDYVMGL